MTEFESSFLHSNLICKSNQLLMSLLVWMSAYVYLVWPTLYIYIMFIRRHSVSVNSIWPICLRGYFDDCMYLPWDCVGGARVNWKYSTCCSQLTIWFYGTRHLFGRSALHKATVHASSSAMNRNHAIAYYRKRWKIGDHVCIHSKCTIYLFWTMVRYNGISFPEWISATFLFLSNRYILSIPISLP